MSLARRLARRARRCTLRRSFQLADFGVGKVQYQAALGRRGGWIVWDGSAGNSGSHPIRLGASRGAD